MIFINHFFRGSSLQADSSDSLGISALARLHWDSWFPEKMQGAVHGKWCFQLGELSIIDHLLTLICQRATLEYVVPKNQQKGVCLTFKEQALGRMPCRRYHDTVVHKASRLNFQPKWYQIRWTTNKPMDILDRMACSIIDYIGFCWWNKYMAWSFQSSYVWMISIFTRQQSIIGTVFSNFGGCLSSSIRVRSKLNMWQLCAFLGIPQSPGLESCWTRNLPTNSYMKTKTHGFSETVKNGSLGRGFRSWTWFIFRYWQWRNINLEMEPIFYQER